MHENVAAREETFHIAEVRLSERRNILLSPSPVSLVSLTGASIGKPAGTPPDSPSAQATHTAGGLERRKPENAQTNNQRFVRGLA